MIQIQDVSQRSLRMGVVAAALLSVAALMPALNASHASASPGESLGIAGSANAVEHGLLSHLNADFGVDGSANVQEHRLA